MIIEKLNIDEIKHASNRDELRKTLFNEYKNNSEFYQELISFGLTDDDIFNNVGALKEYFEQFKICPNCKDIASCPLQTGNIIRKMVSFKDGILQFEFGYCDSYLKLKNTESLIFINDIDPSYEQDNFAKINVSESRTDLLLFLTQKLYKNDLNSPLIFVNSSAQSGGTYITSLFLKQYVQNKNVSGIYANSFERIAELNDLLFSDKSTFNERINMYINVPVLVLNKLSNAYINDFIRDNIIFPILSARANNNLLTIITSELSFDDFCKLFSGKNVQGQVRANQIKKILTKFKQFDISTDLDIY